MTIALVVDYLYIPFKGNPHNFMFFFYGDGTPFTLFHDLVRGNKIANQIIIYILQCGYIGAFYAIYYPIARSAQRRKEAKQKQEVATENE